MNANRRKVLWQTRGFNAGCEYYGFELRQGYTPSADAPFEDRLLGSRPSAVLRLTQDVPLWTHLRNPLALPTMVAVQTVFPDSRHTYSKCLSIYMCIPKRRIPTVTSPQMFHNSISYFLHQTYCQSDF